MFPAANTSSRFLPSDELAPIERGPARKITPPFLRHSGKSSIPFKELSRMSHDPFFPFSSEVHYLRLRDRLIRYFAARRCHCAVDLADDTLLRVLLTHAQRPGDCSLDRWTFAVARNVLREWRRCNRRTVQLDVTSPPPVAWRYKPERHGLDLDLLPLDISDRAFLREYFIEKTGARVLASESGMSAAGVRSRAHRLTRRLRVHLLCTDGFAVKSRVPVPIQI
jgi:DNA-directed RNA polymerase specialized sigma24 family protein